ncbi:hypothetical protein HELRODRAFT_178094 [Helobdella robusta]|uniref:DUF659 domain-containing protein n=1 Tax=Helobdella robusta TaxID=6412 RepID=T1FCQ4_HELRO|nr:hypothetical protein HELRODRAFT_178094 [Helobdella robusta]ESN97309.1 hypothetical protein HELRODRAFT_178094 [Helobdella robusta]
MLFDVTNKTGQWLCAEDKKFYQIQIQSRGKTGYATTKNASQSTIHPSKRKIAGKVNDKLEQKDSFEESSNDSSDNEDSQSSSDDSEATQLSIENFDQSTHLKQSQQSMFSAVSLVQSGKLSVRRAAIVSTILNKSGVKITTPSQSGVYRAVYREASKVMKTLMNTLCNSSWCIHFDGKIIKKKEHQVVLLRNEVKEVRLAVLVLPDGKATTIASAIQKTLDDYNLWAAIKMIVSDTTNVNTGSKSGVVVRLQKLFVQHGESAPVFIGCQHHILDRVLRHVCDALLGDSTESPNMNYPFVSKILKDYEMLKKDFESKAKKCTPNLKEQEVGWRDDMKFLHHLICVFKHFKNFQKIPKVNFKALPGISNARWNSRAIFALLTFILLPDERKNLQKLCEFICGQWSDAWFSDHYYRTEQYEFLLYAVNGYPKALRCFQTHWSQSPSSIHTQRSNVCAERTIKVLQDIAPLCHSSEKLNLRFIFTNKSL